MDDFQVEGTEGDYSGEPEYTPSTGGYLEEFERVSDTEMWPS
jgi:hypothetical protein